MAIFSMKWTPCSRHFEKPCLQDLHCHNQYVGTCSTCVHWMNWSLLKSSILDKELYFTFVMLTFLFIISKTFDNFQPYLFSLVNCIYITLVMLTLSSIPELIQTSKWFLQFYTDYSMTNVPLIVLFLSVNSWV